MTIEIKSNTNSSYSINIRCSFCNETLLSDVIRSAHEATGQRKGSLNLLSLILCAKCHGDLTSKLMDMV